MQTQTVEKIVANPTTDGIIIVLDDGNVIGHLFKPFSHAIKHHFTGETDGSEALTDYLQSSYDTYAYEVEHPDAQIVYTKQEGWLI